MNILSRVLEQDLELGGHLVPCGTVAVLCHMTMGHSAQVPITGKHSTKIPKTWMPRKPDSNLCQSFMCLVNPETITCPQYINNPELFLPERWIKGSQEYVRMELEKNHH